MTEDRYGNYTCVASNKLGTANASVPLIRKLSFYLLVANWSGEESEGLVLWMSLGICALRSVFLGEQKLKLSPVLQLGAYISPVEVVSYFLVISFFEC